MRHQDELQLSLVPLAETSYRALDKFSAPPLHGESCMGAKSAPFEQLAESECMCPLIWLAGMGRSAVPVLASCGITGQLTTNVSTSLPERNWYYCLLSLRKKLIKILQEWNYATHHINNHQKVSTFARCSSLQL